MVRIHLYRPNLNADIVQLAERARGRGEVISSTLVVSTTYAAMAQSVERRLAKAKVASSILVSRSKGTYSKLEMVKETICKIVLNGFKSLCALIRLSSSDGRAGAS